MATAISPVVNPNNLKIEGWYCHDGFSKKQLILLGQDIRDIVPQGLVVNDHDVLAEPNDLIRLKDVLSLHFELVGKPVYTNNKSRLGKVDDFAVEVETLYIQKFYISQSLIKSFSGGGLSVDRSQIIEITDKKVVIQEPLKPTKAGIATAPVTS